MLKLTLLGQKVKISSFCNFMLLDRKYVNTSYIFPHKAGYV